MVFFELSSAALAALLFGVVIGTTLLGAFVGRRLRHLSDDLKEPFAVLQGALLGIVGLVLAFGLSLAVSRYENRREAVVDEANTIGTTYLRSQTLEEPMRSLSIRDLRLYVDTRHWAHGLGARQRRGGRRCGRGRGTRARAVAGGRRGARPGSG